MTEVVAYKFGAFRGSKDLVGRDLYQDDTLRGTRSLVAGSLIGDTL